jgi:hypothetical protein
MDNSEIQTASGLILDRRQLIAGASALGLSAIVGASPAMAQGAPKKGGTLRMGMEGNRRLFNVMTGPRGINNHFSTLCNQPNSALWR